MLSMAKREILPACIEYSKTVYKNLVNKKSALPNANFTRDEEYATRISDLVSNLMDKIDTLDESTGQLPKITDEYKKAQYFANKIIPNMEKLRYVADSLEEITGSEYWPMPTYNELLFNI